MRALTTIFVTLLVLFEACVIVAWWISAAGVPGAGG